MDETQTGDAEGIKGRGFFARRRASLLTDWPFLDFDRSLNKQAFPGVYPGNASHKVLVIRAGAPTHRVPCGQGGTSYRHTFSHPIIF